MSCKIIVVDNFYSNPDEVRNYALTCKYYNTKYFCKNDSNFPGLRTETEYAQKDIQDMFQKIVINFGGKISDFQTPHGDSGRFQLTTANNTSWVHKDGTNWGGIIYLTPNPPSNSGTGFFKPTIDIDKETDKNKYANMDNWQLVDKVENIYNRLVLFRGDELYHRSLDYFGDNIYNGRLTHVFFFNTEF